MGTPRALYRALYENHPLCDKPLITLADLDGEPMILYPNSPMHGLIQVIASAFRAEGVRLFIEQAVDDVMTAVALVASGFGVSITTESASNLRLPGWFTGRYIHWNCRISS